MQLMVTKELTELQSHLYKEAELFKVVLKHEANKANQCKFVYVNAHIKWNQ